MLTDVAAKLAKLKAEREDIHPPGEVSPAVVDPSTVLAGWGNTQSVQTREVTQEEHDLGIWVVVICVSQACCCGCKELYITLVLACGFGVGVPPVIFVVVLGVGEPGPPPSIQLHLQGADICRQDLTTRGENCAEENSAGGGCQVVIVSEGGSGVEKRLGDGASDGMC